MMSKTVSAFLSAAVLSMGLAHAQTAPAPAPAAPAKTEAAKCDPKKDKDCKVEQKK
jgi:hypothetical protein